MFLSIMSQSVDRLKQLEEIEKVRIILSRLGLSLLLLHQQFPWSLFKMTVCVICHHFSFFQSIALIIALTLFLFLLSFLQDVVKVIRSAGETLEELSKDNPSEDRINSTATKFLKSLEVRKMAVYKANRYQLFKGWIVLSTG